MRIIIFIISIFSFSILNAQNEIDKWFIKTNFGIEKHDKRLFGYHEKDVLQNSQPEFWGTYHFSASANRKLTDILSFEIYTGIGLNYERATFRRPFNHYYFNDELGYIFLFMNLYEQIHLEIPINSFYKISDTFIVGLSITPNVGLWKSTKNTNVPEDDTFPLSKSKLEFHSIEVNPNIGFKWGKVMINFNCRLFNFQKIDKIIFYSGINDPRVDQKFEVINPFKMNLSFSYFLM